MKKPSLEEIESYMQEKGVEDPDQPEAFYDYHESGGWMVGKKKMKCWKAAVRTWIRNAKKWSNTREKSNRNYTSHADRQRQQAADAMRELEAMEYRNGKDNAGSVCQTGRLI